MRNKVFLLLLTIIVWEIVVLVLAFRISELDTVKYQLAARFSARTSFFIFSGLLLLTGIKGLKQIYDHENLRGIFILFLFAFAANHLIHFIFIALNYHANDLILFHVKNIFGAIGYVMLAVAPLYLWPKRELTKILHLQINGFLFIIAAIFFITYFGRFSKTVALSSPMLLYKVYLVVLVLAIVLNIYRFVQERKRLI